MCLAVWFFLQSEDSDYTYTEGTESESSDSGLLNSEVKPRPIGNPLDSLHLYLAKNSLGKLPPLCH